MLRKLLTYFFVWLAKKRPETIVMAYAMVQTDFKKHFVISAKEVEVKKGKRKYTLLFVETKLGQYKFWVKNGRVVIDQHPAFLKEQKPDKTW